MTPKERFGPSPFRRTSTELSPASSPRATVFPNQRNRQEKQTFKVKLQLSNWLFKTEGFRGFRKLWSLDSKKLSRNLNSVWKGLGQFEIAAQLRAKISTLSRNGERASAAFWLWKMFVSMWLYWIPPWIFIFSYNDKTEGHQVMRFTSLNHFIFSVVCVPHAPVCTCMCSKRNKNVLFELSSLQMIINKQLQQANICSALPRLMGNVVLPSAHLKPRAQTG